MSSSISELVKRLDARGEFYIAERPVDSPMTAAECCDLTELLYEAARAIESLQADVERLTLKDQKWFDEFWEVEGERRAVCLALEHHQNASTPASYVAKQVMERLKKAEAAVEDADRRVEEAEASGVERNDDVTASPISQALRTGTVVRIMPNGTRIIWEADAAERGRAYPLYGSDLPLDSVVHFTLDENDTWVESAQLATPVQEQGSIAATRLSEDT
jgi:hypothetical protein